MNLKRAKISIIILLISSALSASDATVSVERIEFRGIKNIDKYGIIRNSKAKVSDKGIIINLDILKEVLDRCIMIENYDLDVEKNLLTITVDERYPLFMLLKVEKNISVHCLADEKGNVIDTGRFFKTDMPIIIVEKDFFDNEKNAAYVKGLFDNLVQIGKNKNGFAGELSEIEIFNEGGLRVKLKNRKTDFLIKNDLNGFRKIEKSAAYLDEVNSYPEKLDLNDNRILIRR